MQWGPNIMAREDNALVRVTVGVVSAAFGETECGGSFLWLSLETKVLL